MYEHLCDLVRHMCAPAVEPGLGSIGKSHPTFTSACVSTKELAYPYNACGPPRGLLVGVRHRHWHQSCQRCASVHLQAQQPVC